MPATPLRYAMPPLPMMLPLYATPLFATFTRIDTLPLDIFRDTDFRAAITILRHYAPAAAILYYCHYAR